MKVTVVGAGNVGATAANVLATKGFASEVVLIDIKEGLSEGKAMDIMQTAHMLNFNTKVTGVTNDYAATAGSQVIIITSGIPRKPGMSREDLIGVNAGIVGGVMDSCLKHSPDAIFIIVSNPMDAMTYLALKNSKLPRNRILGQGGMLDSSRFRYFLSKALQKAGYNATPTDIDGMVIGGHSDKTMVPLVSLATYKGIPVTQLLSQELITEAVEQTKVGGATLTKLLGTSAWYAPGAAAAAMVEAIALDANKLIPCCVYLDGEYGEKDLCIGVPAILGKNGLEKIVEVKLEGDEKAKFDESVAAARNTNSKLGDALKA
ncbi:MAG: malate dehydrogenase [Selenomonadaceae bacterium]|nr:malate dehydrogenase [Selenomonadaceae bacterium]MBR1858057.1 malate dehydrogenase [Selenomonadaceae bacterium]